MNIFTLRDLFSRRRDVLLLVIALLSVGCASNATVQPRTDVEHPSAVEVVDYGRLINISGRQRMLTQRIVKSYLQLLLKVEVSVAGDQLRVSLNQFEEQLREIEAHQHGVEADRILEQVRILWSGFRTSAGASPTREGALALREQSERLLAASELLIVELVDSSPTDLLELVNVAGRQRMLSQRYSMLYLQAAAGLGDEPNLHELERVRTEFEEALQWLRDSPDNTVATTEVLAEMTTLWVWLDGALKIRSEKYYPWIVADASEKMLTAAETLTSLYAGLSRASG